MVVVVPAVPGDAGELLTVSLAAFAIEARALAVADIPPLRDALVDVRAAIAAGSVLVALDLAAGLPGRIVGGVRLEAVGPARAGYLGRLAVAPDRHGEGIGGALVDAVVTAATGRFDHLDLTTPRQRSRNVAFYTRRGWSELAAGPGTPRPAVDDVGVALVWMRRGVAAVEPVVRALDPAADATAVAGLWAAAVAARLRSEGVGDGTEPAMLIGLGAGVTVRPGVFVVVRELAGRPVAAAVAGPARTRDGAGDVVPGVVHLSAVCADPVRWGAGSGAAVVTALLDVATARGFQRAQLAVNASNERACALYARLGFVQEPGWQAADRSGAVLQRWSRPLPRRVGAA